MLSIEFMYAYLQIAGISVIHVYGILYTYTTSRCELAHSRCCVRERENRPCAQPYVCREPEGASRAGMEDAVVPTLTPRQVELIEGTWKLVAADLQGAGTVMFLK